MRPTRRRRLERLRSQPLVSERSAGPLLQRHERSPHSFPGRTTADVRPVDAQVRPVAPRDAQPGCLHGSQSHGGTDILPAVTVMMPDTLAPSVSDLNPSSPTSLWYRWSILRRVEPGNLTR